MAELAGRQHGVVAVRQLLGLGVPRHVVAARVEANRFHRVHRGVYAVGHSALTFEGRELAAVLACGEWALLSHRSAACRHALLRSRSARIEVTAPRACKPRAAIVVHSSRLIHPDDRAVVDGIPVTSVARTIVDLAEVETERRLADAIDQAEQRRLFDLRAIEAVVERLPGRRGAPRLRRVLARYEPEEHVTRSPAESRFLHICRQHGLPAPQANIWIGDEEIDFYWPDARLGVEVDSRTHHDTTRAFHEDRRRDRRMAALDVHVIRVTSEDLTDGPALATELKRIRGRRIALLARGLG